MHVLVLPSWYPTREQPQVGIYFARQAQAAAQAGAHVGVVYPERQSLRLLASGSVLRRRPFQVRLYDEEGIPTLRQHGWNLLWRLPWRLDERIQAAQDLAARYIERFGRPDLLHAHSTRWAGAAAARIGQDYGIPYVVTEHFSGFHRGILAPHQQALAREGFRQAQCVAAVSSPLKALLIQRGFADPARTVVLPNFVDETFFTCPSQPRPAPPFRFITLSALHPWKGIDVLLHAFARAFPHRPDVLLEIGGEGAERRRLERTVPHLGLAGRVVFLGALTPEGVRHALWRAHALVQPSFYETFSLVLIEAMAAGLPVVATTAGGPLDIVTPTAGRLVPPRNPDALAQALCGLQAGYQSYAPQAIRQHAVQHFGRATFVRRLLAFYRTAIDISV